MTRRRREPERRAFPLGRTETIAAAFLILGGLAIIVAVIASSGGGGDDASASQTVAPTAAAIEPSGAPFNPTDADGLAITALAQKSIEVLPQGQWPTLYADFVPDFTQRCSQAEFVQAGVDAATNLGEDLALIGYVGMQDVTLNGDTAQGTIIGELKGKSKYLVSASFQNVDGVWKIAPGPDTTGCQSFSVISQ